MRAYLARATILRLALTEGADVDGGGVRQNGGAKSTVRGVEHTTERSGKAVDCAKTGVGEREAAEEAGEGHVGTGGGIGTFGISAGQGSKGAGEAVEAVDIGKGVGAAGDVGLDELGDGVEARGGGDLGWEVRE